MMRIFWKILVVFSVTFFMSCTSGEVDSSQSEPAVNNTTTQEKKRTSRPSAGPLAPISLGEVNVTLGKETTTIKQFKSGYNDLTVTNETITIRITDMNGASYLVVLQGVEKNSSLSTAYGAIFGGINQGPRALITFGSGDNSYQWKSGTLKVEELDPKTGAFRAEIINGKAVNARNSVNGELVDVEFEVDMRFENIVNLTNSPF
jgi:hypothetical protein